MRLARLALWAALATSGCRAEASLREGLIADAIDVEQPSWKRPSHVASPKPGTFGEAAEPVIASLVAGVGPLPSPEVIMASPPAPPVPATSTCDAFVVAGYAPAALTDACKAECAAKAKALAPLLAATYAEDAGLPPSLRTNDPALALPRTRRVFLALRDLEIDARVAVADGRPIDAYHACGDRLALVRDLTWGGLLLDDTIGQTSIGQVLVTCALSVPAFHRPQLASAFAMVREGMPPFSRIVKRETSLMEVRAWGYELDEAQRSRLPPELAKEVRPSEASRDDWRAFRAHAAKIEAALALPTAEERLKKVQELDAEARGAAPAWARDHPRHPRPHPPIDALVWALRAIEVPTLALPVDLAPFTKAERPSPETLVVTVTIEADPLREIVMRLGPGASPSP
jgi:hypothetical protein